MKNFIKDFKDIDSSISNVMKNGFKFSLVLALFFTYILFLYSMNPVSHVVFEIGYLGIKGSLMFFVAFFVGAMSANIFKNNV